MRRSPLKRSRPKPWFRAEEDKVTPELHDYILDRDRICIAARVEGPEHQCRTRFGMPHAPNDRRLLTLDHVHHAATLGVRAKSDRWHLVAACGDANNNGWCSAHRAEERSWITLKEGPRDG